MRYVNKKAYMQRGSILSGGHAGRVHVHAAWCARTARAITRVGASTQFAHVKQGVQAISRCPGKKV